MTDVELNDGLSISRSSTKVEITDDAVLTYNTSKDTPMEVSDTSNFTLVNRDDLNLAQGYVPDWLQGVLDEFKGTINLSNDTLANSINDALRQLDEGVTETIVQIRNEADARDIDVQGQLTTLNGNLAGAISIMDTHVTADQASTISINAVESAFDGSNGSAESWILDRTKTMSDNISAMSEDITAIGSQFTALNGSKAEATIVTKFFNEAGINQDGSLKAGAGKFFELDAKTDEIHASLVTVDGIFVGANYWDGESDPLPGQLRVGTDGFIDVYIGGITGWVKSEKTPEIVQQLHDEAALSIVDLQEQLDGKVGTLYDIGKPMYTASDFNAEYLSTSTSSGSLVSGSLVYDTAHNYAYKYLGDDISDVDLTLKVFATDPEWERVFKNNNPEADWIANNTEPLNESNMYYDRSSGIAYRYTKVPDVEHAYQWVEIRDDGITNALAKANEAKEAAATKNRVFPQAEAPTGDDLVEGDMWIPSDDIDTYKAGITYYYHNENGSVSWIRADNYVGKDEMISILDAANYIGTATVDGQSLVDYVADPANTGLDKMAFVFSGGDHLDSDTYNGSTPETGDIYIENSLPVNGSVEITRTFRKTDDGWTEISNNAGLTKLVDKVDYKRAVYNTNDEPAGTAEVPLENGDLWITSDGLVKAWMNDAWKDTDNRESRRKTTTYYQNTAPEGTADEPLANGDMWIPTEDVSTYKANRLYFYDKPNATWERRDSYMDLESLQDTLQSDNFMKNLVIDNVAGQPVKFSEYITNEVNTGTDRVMVVMSGADHLDENTYSSAPENGDLYMEHKPVGYKTVLSIYRKIDDGWEKLSSNSNMLTELEDAIDSKTKIFTTSYEPDDGMEVGDIWINAVTKVSKIYYDGKWVDITNKDAVAGFKYATNALSDHVMTIAEKVQFGKELDRINEVITEQKTAEDKLIELRGSSLTTDPTYKYEISAFRHRAQDSIDALTSYYTNVLNIYVLSDDTDLGDSTVSESIVLLKDAYSKISDYKSKIAEELANQIDTSVPREIVSAVGEPTTNLKKPIGTLFTSTTLYYDADGNRPKVWLMEATGWRALTLEEAGNMDIKWAGGSSKIIKGPNGEITGWEFSDGSNKQSEFKIAADRFMVSNGNKSSGQIFEVDVDTGKVTINGSLSVNGINDSGLLTTSTTISGDQIESGNIKSNEHAGSENRVTEIDLEHGTITIRDTNGNIRVKIGKLG